MKILKKVYKQMIDCPEVPPECGGILGAQRDGVISEIVLDMGISRSDGNVYYPNIEILNQIITEWEKDGIQFLGIFHTHALQWFGLSNDDKVYIIDILNAMPQKVQFLYFPLVFPRTYIRGYCARKKGDVVDIIDDNIEII